MLRRLIVLSGAVIALATSGWPQSSSEAVSARDAIAARQASLDMSVITLRSMVDAMKAGQEAKTQSYPAASLAKWARILPGLFVGGSGRGETSENTQALPAIWRDRAGFDRAAANYAQATARLAAFAAANDTAAFTKQLDDVRQACSICHATYKAGDQGPPRK